MPGLCGILIRICLNCRYIIYASICWSASTSTYLYLFVSSGVRPFFSLLWNRESEAERGRSYLHCFPLVGASVAKQSEAALNHMLESVRKFVDIVIRAPQHVMT